MLGVMLKIYLCGCLFTFLLIGLTIWVDGEFNLKEIPGLIIAVFLSWLGFFGIIDSIKNDYEIREKYNNMFDYQIWRRNNHPIFGNKKKMMSMYKHLEEEYPTDISKEPAEMDTMTMVKELDNYRKKWILIKKVFDK